MIRMVNYRTRSVQLVYLIALIGLVSIACSQAEQQEPSATEPATQPPQQTSRGTAETSVDGKKISINYGKPSLGGRDLLSMAPAGTVWRLGMNEATEITSEADLMPRGQHLAAGTYSLWVRKTAEDQWTLAFHQQTGIWGAPELREGYAAEIPLTLEQTDELAEQLVISLAGDGKDVKIEIHWGGSKLLGSFQTM